MPPLTSLKKLYRQSKASIQQTKLENHQGHGNHPENSSSQFVAGMTTSPNSSSIHSNNDAPPPPLPPSHTRPVVGVDSSTTDSTTTSTPISPPNSSNATPSPIPVHGKKGNESSEKAPLSGASSQKHNVPGMAGLSSPHPALGSLPTSQYAPHVANIADNAWVHQKVLLIHGTIGNAQAHGHNSSRPGTAATSSSMGYCGEVLQEKENGKEKKKPKELVGGSITVSRLDDDFPPISWPVTQLHFKALVYLLPGVNRLRLEFHNPQLSNSGTSNPIHTSYLTVHMIPPLKAPPLHLIILVAKDSPAVYDAIPARAKGEGNGLDMAIRKFRMAAYLWQAFTAEQMQRNKLGRRVFRFDEEWIQGTSCQKDIVDKNLRSEARIHVIRSSKTLAELRDVNKAQQYRDGKDKHALFRIAGEEVRSYFKIQKEQTFYATVLFLDSHWDTKLKTVVAHAALGSGSGNLRLAIFGSHCLQSYPSFLEEVVPAFTDDTPTDTNYVANDNNQAGTSWEAANIGIGAHLHEVGHLFGCPHQEHGIMARGFVHFHRCFVTEEAACSRTKTPGGQPVLSAEGEGVWHRLDLLRFRSHPCFRFPHEHSPHLDTSIQAYPVDPGTVIISAASGISFVEVFPGGPEEATVCHSWIEYPHHNEGGDGGGSGSHTPTQGKGTTKNGIQRQITLTEQDLRGRLPRGTKADVPVKFVAHSLGGGRVLIPDMGQWTAKSQAVKLPNGKLAYSSQRLGNPPKGPNRQALQVMFHNVGDTGHVLSRVTVHHGRAVDGLEFVYDDGTQQLFGRRGGRPTHLDLDIRRGEGLAGFAVRAGAWIDAIQVWTTTGRKTAMLGNIGGGELTTFAPPLGFTVCV